MSAPPPVAGRGHLLAFAGLSASYFAHIGFFNPYLPLWLKDLGLPIFTISLLASVCLLYTSPIPRDQRGTRMPSSA